MTVTIGSDLRQGSTRAEKAVRKGVKRGVNNAGTIVKRKAVALCPVDTGRLRGSIEKMVVEAPDDAFYSIIGTSVYYAPYVEFGTGTHGAASNPVFEGEEPVPHSTDVKGHFAQPFMRPAVYSSEVEVKEEIMKGVEAELEKAFN